MKRRFMMWMTIVCILVVGVSVTRMTHDFVVSQGVETAAIVNVMDAGNMAVSAGASLKEALPEANEKNEAVPGPGGEKTSVTTETKDLPAQAEAGMGGPGETVDSYAVAMAAETDMELEAVPEAAAEEAVSETSGEGLVSPENTDSEAMADMDSTMTEHSDSLSASAIEEAIQETVKSPLNPVVETAAPLQEAAIIETLYTAEEFYRRFETVETDVTGLWENVTADNSVAYYAAAEQERVLWDYELNKVYGAIRSKMSEKEAEELKILELEWMKERDLYAEKVAVKSPKKNAQNQNPEYTKALAKKTKERCYWLVSEYEEVLNRADMPSE